SVWNQVALLQNQQGLLAFWLRDSRCSCNDVRQCRDGPYVIESLPALSLYAVALHDNEGRAETGSGYEANNPKWLLRAKSMVQVPADSFCDCQVARRSQGRAAGTL